MAGIPRAFDYYSLTSLGVPELQDNLGTSLHEI